MDAIGIMLFMGVIIGMLMVLYDGYKVGNDKSLPFNAFGMIGVTLMLVSFIILVNYMIINLIY